MMHERNTFLHHPRKVSGLPILHKHHSRRYIIFVNGL